MDFMIDIETLGKKPGCVIASIGIVEFDPRAGTISRSDYIKLDIAKQIKNGRVIDADTLVWWFNQSGEAIADTFGGETVSLPLGLCALDCFIKANLDYEKSGFWANSPSFDLAILEEAHAAFGFKEPWSYRQPRDCRTLFDVTGFDYKTFSKTIGNTEHNALNDAKVQAFGVIEAFKGIK